MKLKSHHVVLIGVISLIALIVIVGLTTNKGNKDISFLSDYKIPLPEKFIVIASTDSPVSPPAEGWRSENRKYVEIHSDVHFFQTTEFYSKTLTGYKDNKETMGFTDFIKEEMSESKYTQVHIFVSPRFENKNVGYGSKVRIFIVELTK